MKKRNSRRKWQKNNFVKILKFFDFPLGNRKPCNHRGHTTHSGPYVIYEKKL